MKGFSPSTFRPGRAGWTGRIAAIFLAGFCLAALPRLGAQVPVWKGAGDGLSSAQHELEGPWSVSIVRIERTNTMLRLRPMLAFGDRIGLNTLSEQVDLVPREAGRVLAAINGDFYATENEVLPGDPRGLLIQEGALVSGPVARDCLWITPDGAPRIGTVRSQFTVQAGDSAPESFLLNTDYDGGESVVYTSAARDAIGEDARRGWIVRPANGSVWPEFGPGRRFEGVVQGRMESGKPGPGPAELLIAPSQELRSLLKPGVRVVVSTATEPQLAGVRTAIGGGPALVRRGEVLDIRVNKARERHPRSALGWNETHLFLVAVDGRQPGHSVGMTLPELAAYLQRIGCTEAVNLDGGGSTELILRGRILNSPCYGHERRTASGLAVLLSEPKGSGAKSP